MRFSESLRAELMALVDDANERARLAGLPQVISPSALVSLWIRERIGVETAKLLGRKK
jgi:hypothetical protein